MDTQAIWTATIIGASLICGLAWFAAIGLVALKLGSANGSYRLLTLILALCMIFTLQAVGFLFTSLAFPTVPDTTPLFRGGTLFSRFCSLLAASAVLYFGRPNAPPKTRSPGAAAVDSENNERPGNTAVAAIPVPLPVVVVAPAAVGTDHGEHTHPAETP